MYLQDNHNQVLVVTCLVSTGVETFQGTMVRLMMSGMLSEIMLLEVIMVLNNHLVEGIMVFNNHHLVCWILVAKSYQEPIVM